MVSIAGPVLGVLGIIAAMVGSVWIFKSKRSRVSLHHKTSLELQSRSTLPHLAEGAPSLLVRGPRHIPYRLPFREFLQTRGLVSGSGNAGYLGPQSAPSRPLSARMPQLGQNHSPDRTVNPGESDPLSEHTSPAAEGLEATLRQADGTPTPQLLQVVEYQRMVDDLELQSREQSGLPPPYPVTAEPGAVVLNPRVREYQRLMHGLDQRRHAGGMGRGLQEASRTGRISNLPTYDVARGNNGMGTRVVSHEGGVVVGGGPLAVAPPNYEYD